MFESDSVAQLTIDKRSSGMHLLVARKGKVIFDKVRRSYVWKRIQ
jgi:hypothetical protein